MPQKINQTMLRFVDLETVTAQAASHLNTGVPYVVCGAVAVVSMNTAVQCLKLRYDGLGWSADGANI
jgi:hypothetical protein